VGVLSPEGILEYAVVSVTCYHLLVCPVIKLDNQIYFVQHRTCQGGVLVSEFMLVFF